MTDRRTRDRINWVTRGRADAYVTLADLTRGSLPDQVRGPLLDAYRDQLALEPADVERARRRQDHERVPTPTGPPPDHYWGTPTVTAGTGGPVSPPSAPGVSEPIYHVGPNGYRHDGPGGECSAPLCAAYSWGPARVPEPPTDAP